jgi:Plant transposon protein
MRKQRRSASDLRCDVSRVVLVVFDCIRFTGKTAQLHGLVNIRVARGLSLLFWKQRSMTDGAFSTRFFGKPGSWNDINVLESSPLRSAIIAGRWPPKVEYWIDNVGHNLGYVLADGMCRSRRCFMQSVPRVSNPSAAQRACSALQEAV